MNTRESNTRRAAFLLALCLACTCAVTNVLTVHRVHKGDLIEFEGGWTTRLTGVESPAPDTPIGRQAHDFASGKRFWAGMAIPESRVNLHID